MGCDKEVGDGVELHKVAPTLEGLSNSLGKPADSGVLLQFLLRDG